MCPRPWRLNEQRMTAVELEARMLEEGEASQFGLINAMDGDRPTALRRLIEAGLATHYATGFGKITERGRRAEAAQKTHPIVRGGLSVHD